MYFFCIFTFEYFDPYDHYAVCWVTLRETSKFLTVRCKNLQENIGDLFVKLMLQVTKSLLYPLLSVSDYYVTLRQRAQSIL